MKLTRYAVGLLAAALCVSAVRAADEPAIEIKEVKLDGLEKLIASHKGKVVVVDFWATFCLPCREEFPNLVKMHKELADKGVVCISVSIDEPEKKNAALRFLRLQEATFPNLLLNETPETIEEKLGFSSIPTVFVYGKDGKAVKKFNARSEDTVFTYKDVRKVVEPLVAGGK